MKLMNTPTDVVLVHDPTNVVPLLEISTEHVKESTDVVTVCMRGGGRGEMRL